MSFIFNERLKELMEINNLTANDVKNISNVSLSLVYKWLNNELRPKTNKLIEISDYFNCSIDFLVGRIDNFNKIYNKQIPLFSSHLKKIMNGKNITEYRLNKDTHISRSRFYEWSIDKKLPNIDSLIILADYFDCSIDYLIGRED